MQDVQCGFCTFSDDLLLSIPQLCPGTRERTQPSVLCPGWTQISVSKVDTDADTESLCIWYCQTGGTGADVGCYNPAATDLTFGGGKWPVGTLTCGSQFFQRFPPAYYAMNTGERLKVTFFAPFPQI